VRTVAHDIGQALGCGAVAEKIRRVSIGPFRIEEAIAPEAVTGGENLLPLEQAVEHMPALQLRPSWVPALLNGNPIPPAGYLPLPGAVAPEADPAGAPPAYGVFSPTGKLLAIGTVTAFGQFCPRKVLPAA
jgi:tRNA pseudouridine55 synthase